MDYANLADEYIQKEIWKLLERKFLTQEDLKILDDSGWAHKYNVTTDEMGRGYIQVVGFDNGNYTVHATLNGTLFLKESHSNRAFQVNDGYSYWFYPLTLFFLWYDGLYR